MDDLIEPSGAPRPRLENAVVEASRRLSHLPFVFSSG